jgi:hypothetical protein
MPADEATMVTREKMVLWSVWQAAFGIPMVNWWNNLERVMMAVDDLGCRDLLT